MHHSLCRPSRHASRTLITSLAFGLFLALLPGIGHAQSVLFVGNSFTSWLTEFDTATELKGVPLLFYKLAVSR